MIPTRGQVKTRFRALLDDPNGVVFTDAVFTEAFAEAYDVLFNAALNQQCPRIRIIASYTLPANTASLTPATAGLTDFADYDLVEERLSGSSDRFVALTPRDELTQRDSIDRLVEFVWRYDTFYFIAATTARQLRITYESSGTAPTSDSASIAWDGVLPFLSLYAAGVAGPRKGYDELAATYMARAVGTRFDQGVMGGELYRIIQPRVRSMQHVQIAPKPYTTSRRLNYRRVPYIMAQGGGSTAPTQYSTADGTITGTIDGSNAVFLTIAPLSSATVYRNGNLMTQPSDCSFSGNAITFLGAQIPVPGDVITVEGWI